MSKRPIPFQKSFLVTSPLLHLHFFDIPNISAAKFAFIKCLSRTSTPIYLHPSLASGIEIPPSRQPRSGLLSLLIFQT